jgi:hypothetical protein
MRARLFVLLSFLVAPLAVPAQGPETLETLGSYRLTMPVVRKLMAAAREFENAPDARAAQDEMRDLSRMSIDQAVAVIGKYPSLQKAVASTGMPLREFATASLAFYWATRFLLEDGMRQASGAKSNGPPAHVPLENVELLLKNEEEIRKLAPRG